MAQRERLLDTDLALIKPVDVQFKKSERAFDTWQQAIADSRNRRLQCQP